MKKLFLLSLMVFSLTTFANEQSSALPLTYNGDLDKVLNVKLTQKDGREISKSYLTGSAHFFLDLDAIVFRETDWDTDQVQIELNTAANALATCGISLGQINLFFSNPYRGHSDFNRDQAEEFLFDRKINLMNPRITFVKDYKLEAPVDSYGQTFIINNGDLLKETLQSKIEVIKRKVELSPEQWGMVFSEERTYELFAPFADIVLNSIWIQDSAIYSSSRRTLAHELVHLLTMANHSDLYGNLMNVSGDFRGIALTADQCNRIKASPYLIYEP